MGIEGRMRKGISLLIRPQNGHIIVPGCSLILRGVLGQRLGLPFELDGPDAGVRMGSRAILRSQFWRTLIRLRPFRECLMIVQFISQPLELAPHPLHGLAER